MGTSPEGDTPHFSQTGAEVPRTESSRVDEAELARLLGSAQSQLSSAKVEAEGGGGAGMAAERGREGSQTEKDAAGEEKEGKADGKGV